MLDGAKWASYHAFSWIERQAAFAAAIAEDSVGIATGLPAVAVGHGPATAAEARQWKSRTENSRRI